MSCPTRLQQGSTSRTLVQSNDSGNSFVTTGEEGSGVANVDMECLDGRDTGIRTGTPSLPAVPIVLDAGGGVDGGDGRGGACAGGRGDTVWLYLAFTPQPDPMDSTETTLLLSLVDSLAFVSVLWQIT